MTAYVTRAASQQELRRTRKAMLRQQHAQTPMSGKFAEQTSSLFCDALPCSQLQLKSGKSPFYGFSAMQRMAAIKLAAGKTTVDIQNSSFIEVIATYLISLENTMILSLRYICSATVLTAIFASTALADTVVINRGNFQAKLDQCNAGDGDVCQDLGALFRNDEDARAAGQRENLDLSLQFYERGCALGDTGACGAVNRIYGNSRYSGYDPARALPFFLERCQRRGEDSSDCRTVERLQGDL